MGVTLRRVAQASPLAALVVLAACLPIPHRHTRQAGARFRVTDHERRPIAGATVYVYEASIISGVLRRQASATTDSAGLAMIPRERDSHLVLVLIPDAEAPSVFGWCVEAPGFEPLTRPLDDEGGQMFETPLLPTMSETACPAELNDFKLERGGYASRPAV